MGLILSSVAIGLGLAVAYYVASLRFQIFVSQRSNALVPALTAAGFVIRLTVFAAVMILLALFTDLNIIAVAVVFVVLYTLLSGLGMRRYLSKRTRGGSSNASGSQGGVVGR